MAAWTLSAFRDRSQVVMLTLYKSMVRPKLEYCCPVWNPAKVTEIQKLHRLKDIWKSKLSKSLKIRLFIAACESVLLYRSETWTL